MIPRESVRSSACKEQYIILFDRDSHMSPHQKLLRTHRYLVVKRVFAGNAIFIYVYNRYRTGGACCCCWCFARSP